MVGASGHWNLPPFSRPGAPDGFRLAARDPRLANRAHMHARGLPLRLELAQRACPPTIGGEYEVFGALGKAPPCQTKYDGRTIDRRARWSWGPKLPFRVTLSQLLPGRIGFPKIRVSASALTHPASANTAGAPRPVQARARPCCLVSTRPRSSPPPPDDRLLSHARNGAGRVSQGHSRTLTRRIRRPQCGKREE